MMDFTFPLSALSDVRFPLACSSLPHLILGGVCDSAHIFIVCFLSALITHL